MNRNRVGGVVLVCALAWTQHALAQAPWGIDVWQGDPDGLIVIPGYQAVLVVQPGTYQFSVSPDQLGGETRDLDRVYVDPNLGSVTVSIETPGSPSTTAGCRDLGQVESAPGTTLTLHNCKIGRNAAVLSDIQPDRITGYFNVDRDISPYSIEVEGGLGGAIACRDLEYLSAALDPSGGAMVDVNGTIVNGMYISSSGATLTRMSALAVTGPVTINADVNDVYVVEVDDTLSINGDVSLFSCSPSSLSTSTADINISGHVAYAELANFSGAFAAGSLGYPAPNPPDGLLMLTDAKEDSEVTFAGDVRGDIEIGGEFPDTASIAIGGNVLGQVSNGEGFPLEGSLTIDGDLASGARISLSDFGASESSLISIGGDMLGSVALGDADFAGTLEIGLSSPGSIYTRTGGIAPSGVIRIGGTLSGGLEIGSVIGGGAGPAMLGQIVIDGDNESVIVLNGDFGGSGAGANALIWIKGSQDGAVSVDYDGYDVGDDWYGSATVRLGDTTYTDYTANTPALKLYEVTECKGDMDNDHDVDFFDLDPFVAAFGAGTSYNAAFPGLAGSRIFHGDMNGDNAIDFYDIDGFVARLGICSPEVVQNSGGEGENLMYSDPSALAAQLGTAISAERLPDLIAAMEQLAINSPEGSTTNWSAVLAALAGI